MNPRTLFKSQLSKIYDPYDLDTIQFNTSLSVNPRFRSKTINVSERVNQSQEHKLLSTIENLYKQRKGMPNRKQLTIAQTCRPSQNGYSMRTTTIMTQSTKKSVNFKPRKFTLPSPNKSPWNLQNYYDREQFNKKRQERYSYDESESPSKKEIKEENLKHYFSIFCQEQELNLEQIRRSKQWVISRLQQRYNQRVAKFLALFLEIPMYLDINDWKSLFHKINKLHPEGQIVILFKLFDVNNDKYVSSTDIFQFQVSIQGNIEHVNKDVDQIVKFVQTKLNYMTIDDDENYYLKKSLIFKENLKLSEMITWNEVYQNDLTQEQRKKKGLNYQRQFPFQCFIGSNLYFGEEDEYQEEKVFLSKYPQQYSERNGYSLTFPLFRRAFKNKKCHFWDDIVKFISGMTN